MKTHEFQNRLMAAGLRSQAELRRALAYGDGNNKTTVAKWAAGNPPPPPPVRALLDAAALLSADKQAELWRPIPGLPRDMAQTVRLVMATGLLSDQQRADLLDGILKEKNDET